MKKRAIVILSILSGIFLCMAGVTFWIWQPSPIQSDIAQQIAHLSQYNVVHFLYIGSVYLCYTLFLPVIVFLTIALYTRYPIGSILAGSLFCLGGVIELIATLASLGRWIYAVPHGLKGDIVAIGLFKTLTLQFIALDFGGVILVYAAALVYAILMWNIHRLTSYALLLSTALLITDIPVAALLPSLAILLPTLSIIIYSFACPGLGYIAARLIDSRE